MRNAFAQCLTNDSPDEVAAAFRLLATLPATLNAPFPIVPDASERGLELVQKFRAANPDGALDVLHQVAALPGTTNTSLRPLQIDLLKAAIPTKEDNTNRVVELALIERRPGPVGGELPAPYPLREQAR